MSSEAEKHVLDYSSAATSPRDQSELFYLLYLVGAVVGAIPSYALLGWKCHPIYIGEQLDLLLVWFVTTGVIAAAYASEGHLRSVRRVGLYLGLLSWMPSNLVFYLVVHWSGDYAASWP